MGATLEALYRLQEIELQLVELRQRIAAKQRAARVQERRIATLEAGVTARRGKLRDLQMEADRLDLDMKSNEEKIARLRAALSGAKTNKEYSALLTQLNTDKADTAKVEERALALLTEIDAGRKTLAEEEEHLAAERSRLAELQQAAAEFEAQCSARLKQLTDERRTAAAAIAAPTLDLFERVAGKNDGQAMAMVVRTSPKREEFACSGCNMAVTLEQVNALMSRDEPIPCHICGRILYLETVAESRAR